MSDYYRNHNQSSDPFQPPRNGAAEDAAPWDMPMDGPEMAQGMPAWQQPGVMGSGFLAEDPAPFGAEMQQSGVPFYFFTNNSSKAPEDYVKKLERLGFTGMTRENIMTSGDVMIHYLKTHGGRRIYLAGTPELEAQFVKAGFTLLPSDTETADFAVLGFDKTFNFEKADAISRLITGGVPFLATNIDRVCPLEDGKFCPDCGEKIEL